MTTTGWSSPIFSSANGEHNTAGRAGGGREFSSLCTTSIGCQVRVPNAGVVSKFQLFLELRAQKSHTSTMGFLDWVACGCIGRPGTGASTEADTAQDIAPPLPARVASSPPVLGTLNVNVADARKTAMGRQTVGAGGGARLVQRVQGTSAEVYHEKAVVAVEVELRRASVAQVASAMQEAPSSGVADSRPYMPNQLEGALFCGHLVTDLDSIAGALGAAALYGGYAARASEVNSETAWALERWSTAAPPPIEELVKSKPDAGICLVDHQQRSQLNPAIEQQRIVGIIDHHALQSETVVTTKPIYIDIRPWGSMSTIIAHQFTLCGMKPPGSLAGLLLCAILSDTLNLQGPTTTDWDRTMVALLSELAGVEDIADLAKRQFKAKSQQLATLSAHQLANGDLKEFGVENAATGEGARIGFAVIETTDTEVLLGRRAELLPELLEVKAERELDALFLALVNIVEMKSVLICASGAERRLAALAFGGETSEAGRLMDLGSRVSRKAEFVPPLTIAIATGSDEWLKPPAGEEEAEGSPDTVLKVDPADPHGRVTRVSSVQLGMVAA